MVMAEIPRPQFNVCHVARCIYNIARRQSSNTPRIHNGLIQIHQDRKLQLRLKSVDKALYRFRILTEIDRQDFKVAGMKLVPSFLKRRHFRDAGRTPRCPEIDDDDFAAVFR